MHGVIQRVFQDHYPAYRQAHRLCWRERWAARQIATCRTPAQGWHELRCPSGDYSVSRWNSCKHRSCPLCGVEETERWVAAKELQALACRYHQIVLTISDRLHPLWAYNRTRFTNLMFRAAWGSLKDFLDDPRWLGATPGALAVFQSWGETINTHPHLHFLVTAGGLDAEGRWVAAQSDFLLPSRALSVKFRGKFRALLLQDLQQGELTVPPGTMPAGWRKLLNKLGRRKWHAQIEPPYAHARGLIRYLACYLRRGPIAEGRIQTYDGQSLTIAYKRPAEHATQTFQLSAHEFISRMLLHAPPKGLRVVRAYGLFHHRQRERLEQARLLLSSQQGAAAIPPPSDPGHCADAVAWPADGSRCPRCGACLSFVRVHYPARASPERIAA